MGSADGSRIKSQNGAVSIMGYNYGMQQHDRVLKHCGPAISIITNLAVFKFIQNYDIVTLLKK